MIARGEIIDWLEDDDADRLERLWAMADETRRANVGDAVHLRGLIEISNHCVRRCGYCGLNAGNSELRRYRMSPDEILACVSEARGYGYGTVVIQAGEAPGLTREMIADVVRRAKAEHGLAVTLSLGQRSDADLLAWRAAGADRYLLRFETSNRELFRAIHPPAGGSERDRIEMLRRLREIGYEIGSGVMIGLPGQSYEDLADDIRLFSELDLDMIGVGPFIPHPQTALGTERLGTGSPPSLSPRRQVPGSELMVYKVVALSRLVCPEANIPSTSALATLNLTEGRELGLVRGANVVMPNVTPREYRELYEIYPAKACIRETAAQCHGCIRRRIQSIGRMPGVGPGGRGQFRPSF